MEILLEIPVEVPVEIESRIERWEDLSRWERSEVGRDLRRLGLSYGEIGRIIDVKKSTLATWCRDVDLTNEQKVAIVRRTGSRKGVPRDTQRKRRLEIEAIRREARMEAEELLSDPSWVAGVVMYWAEGSKTARRLRLGHTEPEALLLFQRWTLQYLDADARFRAALNLHADNDEPTARRFWADTLGLDPSHGFTKPFIKPDGTGQRKNHLPFGVCELKMLRSTDAWVKTLAWIDVMRRRQGDYSHVTRAAGAIGSATDS